MQLIVTWKDKVRVRVGEITRKQQFDLWRHVKELGDDESAMITMEELSDFVTAMAITKIEVCDGGQWVAVTETKLYELGETEVVLAWPPSAQSIREFPRSLADDCQMATMQSNGTLSELLSFPLARQMSSQTTSEPASDSVPSSEPTPK